MDDEPLPEIVIFARLYGDAEPGHPLTIRKAAF
jgi:hypothetical protein